MPLPDRPAPEDPTPERTTAVDVHLDDFDDLGALPSAFDLFAGAFFARPDLAFAAAANGGPPFSGSPAHS
ncbi:hypothetical protein [Kitasatospora viridis]|uniref:Uncharacterized protein n=1 Tax=Kitasatospora viridis TaxID=281105 RepID=A0A561TSQ8_9ACTN|nr:hypothetical protein [Kitasatospora viridis]TWF90155.1 hypothetical protein FHX73_13199 [Kitasatospora viridis]